MNKTEELPPVAKKLVQHLGERNYQLKSERYCRQRAETTALSMISECCGDVFEYASKVELWRCGYKLSTVRPYYSKKTGTRTSFAHYNDNNKYIQRCKEGDDPIPVPTGMIVDATHFRWVDDDFVPIPYDEIKPLKKPKLKARCK